MHTIKLVEVRGRALVIVTMVTCEALIFKGSLLMSKNPTSDAFVNKDMNATSQITVSRSSEPCAMKLP